VVSSYSNLCSCCILEFLVDGDLPWVGSACMSIPVIY
jgi:hypothetical protein